MMVKDIGADRALAATPSNPQAVSPLTGFDHGERLCRALDDLIGLHGRRDPENGSELLPPAEQDVEIGAAMAALAKARGEA